MRRSTWIVLGIFVVLALGVFLWQRYGKTDQEAAEPTPTIAPVNMVFDLGTKLVQSFSITDATGESITMQHELSSNMWVVMDQPADMADPTQIEAVASSFSYMTVDTELTTQPPLDAMGLDQPSYTITLDLDNGERNVLFVGDLTPTGTGYYAQVDGKPVVVIAKSDITTLINMLTTPPLKPTYTPTETASLTTDPSMSTTSTLVPTSALEVTVTPSP